MQESIQPRKGYPFLELGNSEAKTKLHVEEMQINGYLMTYALDDVDSTRSRDFGHRVESYSKFV